MKRLIPVLMMGVVVVLTAVLIFQPTATVQALPEYSANVGEPCSSCHISPSGGGARTPRGQAWVGSGKPGLVPDLRAALELLGVNLDIDESDFVAPAGEIPPAAPLEYKVEPAAGLHDLLAGYEGN